MSIEEINQFCHAQQWDKAIAILEAFPGFISHKDFNGVHHACTYGAANMLEFILKKIREYPTEQQDSLLEVFKEERWGRNPLSLCSSFGHVACLKFFVENLGGPEILTKKNQYGWSLAHGIRNRSETRTIETLEYLARTAPNGIGIFYEKTYFGNSALDFAPSKIREYFTPEKIQRLGHENDMKYASRAGDMGALVNLVIHIIRQNIEVKLDSFRENVV